MTLLKVLKRTTAVAAFAAVPFAVSAQTQQGQTETQPQQSSESQQTGQGTDQQAGQQQAGQQQGGQAQKAGQDMVVAKVGDREIRRSDVLTVIGMLPPQLQQQPPEMLIPIALDQLVMRELILQKAQQAGLENDPQVQSLAETASERAKEDAMVQVWLDKELGKAVTDEKVQQAYDTAKQQLGDQVPPIEAVRPQIEQQLRQQAFVDMSQELQSNAQVTLFGPDGQPIAQ